MRRPTIAALAGVADDDATTLQGMDLTPVLSGPDRPGRDEVLLAQDSKDKAIPNLLPGNFVFGESAMHGFLAQGLPQAEAQAGRATPHVRSSPRRAGSGPRPGCAHAPRRGCGGRRR